MEVLSSVNRRQFRSRSAVQELLAEQSGSGLSVRTFCAARGIAPGTFHYWKRRYSSQGEVTEDSAFASFRIDAGMPGLFAEAAGIRIYQPVSAAYLKELIA